MARSRPPGYLFLLLTALPRRRSLAAVVPGSASYHSRMDALTWYGLVAVSLMLLFYALEHRSSVFILAFAAACVMASV